MDNSSTQKCVLFLWQRMAAIADGTRTTAWLQSEDGATGINRPKSLLGMIIGDGTEKSKEIQTFDSGEDFDREWARLTGKEE